MVGFAVILTHKGRRCVKAYKIAAIFRHIGPHGHHALHIHFFQLGKHFIRRRPAGGVELEIAHFRPMVKILFLCHGRIPANSEKSLCL
jgi:hypothetical protein